MRYEMDGETGFGDGGVQFGEWRRSANAVSSFELQPSTVNEKDLEALREEITRIKVNGSIIISSFQKESDN